MNEPVYRWECSICDASGVAESSEAARNMVNRHVALAHPDPPVARRSSQPGARRAT